MKKTIRLLLILSCLTALSACSGNTDKEPKKEMAEHPVMAEFASAEATSEQVIATNLGFTLTEFQNNYNKRAKVLSALVRQITPVKTEGTLYTIVNYRASSYISLIVVVDKETENVKKITSIFPTPTNSDSPETAFQASLSLGLISNVLANTLTSDNTEKSDKISELYANIFSVYAENPKQPAKQQLVDGALNYTVTADAKTILLIVEAKDNLTKE